VEDHYIEGGIYGAVAEALANKSDVKIYGLAVNGLPRSGNPEELLDMYGISKRRILEKLKSLFP